MTFTVKAKRQQLRRFTRDREDWRDVMHTVHTPTSVVEDAIADCKYAYQLDGGVGRYTALYEHFAIWLYQSVPEPEHEDYAYYLVLKDIRQKLFTSKCYIRENKA